MIRRLRQKIFAVMLILLSLVLVGILAVYGVSSFTSFRRRANQSVDGIAMAFSMPNRGGFSDINGQSFADQKNASSGSADSSADSQQSQPADLPGQHGREDLRIQTGTFWVVSLNGDKTVSNVVYGNTAEEITDEQLALVQKLASSNASRGFENGCAYDVRQTDSGTQVVLADFSDERTQLVQQLLLAAGVGLLAEALFVLLSFFISRWIVRPVKETFDKQKQFISDASHELKTPLTVISANVDMLEDTLGTGNKYLGYIDAESRRMAGLVNDLLTLARVENGTGKRDRLKFDLSRAVESAVMPFESVAYEKGIALNTQVAENLWLTGSEGQLQQLAAILCDNALHHTEKGGSVAVCLAAERDHALLRVANTGKPIPPEDRERIFERFYRADEARTGGENRYGLGLAIAQSIAQQHQGRIWVECADGVTSFYVRLPGISHA